MATARYWSLFLRGCERAATPGRWRECHLSYGIVGGMEKTTVYLPDDLKQALRRAARATGRSEAELIREGIGIVTGAHRIAEPKLPLFESGQPDLAERVDEALNGFGER